MVVMQSRAGRATKNPHRILAFGVKQARTRPHSKTNCGLSQCTRQTGALRQGPLQTGPHPIFAPAGRRPRPSLTPACRGECPVRSPHGSDTNSRVAHQGGQHGRETSMPDRSHDRRKIAAGKSEQDILPAIVAQYRPHDTLPAFDEGLSAYQTSAIRMKMSRSAKIPSLHVSTRSMAKRATAAPTLPCSFGTRVCA
jgi:hypothetical protein